MNLPKNMRLRNGVLYVEKTYLGFRLTESLRTRNVELAKKRRDEKIKLFIAGAESGKWGSLERTRTRQAYASIGDVCNLAERYALLQRWAPATLTKYKACLRRILSSTGSSERSNWLKKSTTALKPEVGNQFVEYWLEARADLIEADPDVWQQTVNMALSQLRNAASLFSKRARGYYREKGLKLPDLIGEFGMATRYRARPLTYVLPRADLIERTLSEGAELKGYQWLVFVLAFELGCRGDDMASARLDWLVEDALGQWYLEVPGVKTKGKKMHRKPISGDLKCALLKVVGDRDYLLPGRSYSARLNLVQRGDFRHWMRGLGWQTHELAHELRKLRGCFVYHHSGGQGPLLAKKLLGHSNLSTTEMYYSDNLGIPPQLLPLFKRWADPECESEGAHLRVVG